jgi:hypothetical protein
MLNEEKPISKAQNEQKLLKEMKKLLEEMKFTSSPKQFVEFLNKFEEFMRSRGVSKGQIDIKRLKNR